MKGRKGIENLVRAWNLIGRVPPEAIDLLSHLLCPSKRRYTAQQALNHPFFNKFHINRQLHHSPESLDRLDRRFDLKITPPTSYQSSASADSSPSSSVLVAS